MAHFHGLGKNFSYGDIWENKPAVSKGPSRPVRVPAYKLTSNTAFLNYLHDNGYEVFLDEGHSSFAFTDVTNKRIVLNSNYPDAMLEVFLKHELGHLMLFNVNQFTTVRNNTMRSIIAKEIYTPDNLRKFGIRQLLYVENVIQDIIIETVSNGKCVCFSMLELDGTNLGVKHLTSLEGVALIAHEACKNLLRPQEDFSMPNGDSGALEELLKSMLDGLAADMAEIREEIKSLGKKDFKSTLTRARMMKQTRMNGQLQRIKDIEENKGSLTPSMQRARDILKAELEKLEGDARTEEQRAEEKRARAIAALRKKYENDGELRDMLQEELDKLGADGGETGEGGTRAADAPFVETLNDGDSPNDSQEVSRDITKNLTDHLLGDPMPGGSGHSFDCGLPSPISVKRDESRDNEAFLTIMDTAKKVRKIVIHDDASDNQSLGRNKVPQNEVTYFKSAKREWDETDMMKGKRKLRMSGVNVLIGLDISGSMTTEWGSMFTEMSKFVDSLKGGLDIENVYYFTYHHHLAEWDKDIKKLKVAAGGGNAFGYVYQEIMQELPILQRNEIILITDCGDNLGFNLKDNCEVSRNGESVENHISIIDTEGSGFYSKEGFDEKDWSLHNMHDADLFKAIRSNIERLIEK